MANQFMAKAIKEALKGINKNEGGPFGSVVVKDGIVVGKGHNQVVKKNDPTCHGEVMAIRDACKRLNTFDLSGCELYTTAEPCPMCLGAVLWANIEHVYYGCNILDTEEIGFRDKKFYEFDKSSYLEELDRKACKRLFKKYQELEEKTNY